MRARGAAGLLARQSRAEWPLLGVIAVLVLVSAFLAAAAPRAFNAVTDRALRDALADAPAATTEVTARSTNDLRWTQLREVDSLLMGGMPTALREVLGDRASGVSSTRYDTFRTGSAEPFRPRPYAWLQLRYQTGLLDHVRWVAGRAPRHGTPPRAGAPARLDVALAAGVARQLDMELGDRLRLEFLEPPVGGGRPIVVEVTGLFEPLDPVDRAWTHDPLVLSPGAEVAADGELVAEFATALIAERQVGVLQAAAPTLDFDWHYPVRAEALDGANAPAVLAAIAQMTSAGLPLGAAGSPLGVAPSVTVTSGVADRLEHYAEQATTAAAVSSLVLAGLFAVALFVLALAAQVSVRRRTSALALAGARGASSRQLAALLVVETGLVAVPAAALGYAIAVAAVPARFTPVQVTLVAVLIVACVAFVALGGWLAHRSAPGVRRAPVVAASRRRLAVELGIALLAVGGLVLVRRRGLESSPTGADPFLASVPVLLALAFGVVALRAYPLLLRPLFRLFGARAGAVAFLSLARSVRAPLGSLLPMAVLLLSLGFAVFASAVEATVSAGQRDAAWQAVGADYRLSGTGFLPEELRAVVTTEGVRETVPAVAPDDARFFEPFGPIHPLRFVALDPNNYREVSAGAPSGLVPAALASLGSRPDADDALPAVVSPHVAAVAEAGHVTVNLGTRFGLVVIRVAAVADAFPTDDGGNFAVVDIAALRALDDAPVRPDELFVAAPPSAAGAIQRTVESWDYDVALAGREQVLSGTARVPLVEGTVTAFRWGVIAAAGYCLLGTLLALVLTARARSHLLATLRTLGMDRRQVGAVAALELTPLVVAVVVSGWAVGALLPYLLVPEIDLTAFTGGTVAPITRVDLARAGALGVGLVVVVAAAMSLAVAMERRRRPAPEGTNGVDT